MPQLDVLVFSVQLSLIFFLGWAVYLQISTLILSQYLTYSLFKKLLWTSIVSFVFFIKDSSYNNYIHLVISSTNIVFLIGLFLNFYKSIAINSSKKFIKNSLRVVRSCFNKIFIKNGFFNVISYEKGFGEKSYLSFLNLKNLSKTFLQNLFHKKLHKKLRRKTLNLMVKFTRKYRLEEDETIINTYCSGFSSTIKGFLLI